MADVPSFKSRFQHLHQHGTTVRHVLCTYKQSADDTSSQQWTLIPIYYGHSLHIFDQVAPHSLQKINKKITSRYGLAYL